MTSHSILMPTRNAIRIALIRKDQNVSDWAREHGWTPTLVHRAISSHGGQMVDMGRTWGETRKILMALRDLVSHSGQDAA